MPVPWRGASRGALRMGVARSRLVRREMGVEGSIVRMGVWMGMGMGML